jgi:hypothetical protein
MPSPNPNQIINEVKRLLDGDNRSEIRLNANGGNSILVVCEPEREGEFISCIRSELSQDGFEIVDLNALLKSFVEANRESLDDLFSFLQGSVNQIFKAPSGEQSDDFYSRTIQSISEAFENRKIPVLINTGVLYGAGIDNIQIMESEVVMRSPLPTIILYPATIEDERLSFLGKRPASRYRCIIVP